MVQTALHATQTLREHSTQLTMCVNVQVLATLIPCLLKYVALAIIPVTPVSLPHLSAPLASTLPLGHYQAIVVHAIMVILTSLTNKFVQLAAIAVRPARQVLSLALPVPPLTIETPFLTVPA